MYIVILNIKSLFQMLFKYKYNFFIKLYLNNYIKTYNLITYIIRYYIIYNKNINKHVKNRALVNFSNKKIRAQKGLGKARLRNFSSPICKQGASAFSPIYKKNIYKINKLTYKLVYIYLLLNKRSNFIIIRFENLLIYLYLIYDTLNIYNFINIISKILRLYGIINVKYIIINDIMLQNNLFNKYILLNLLKYDYIIYII